MRIDRQMAAEQIERMLAEPDADEEVGWWAFDMLLEDLEFEPGYEKLLEDVLRSLHYFHDPEPIMRQFYPEPHEILYYLKCLKGEEVYQRSMVVHWKV